MAGGPQQPDPSSAAYDALDRLRREVKESARGEYAVLSERLRGIDKATDLLNETVNRVPTDLQKAMEQIRELMEVKFHSVDLRFDERDTRGDRESRDNTLAVGAAFAAQEKQAAAQNDANQEAIRKSEAATAETLNKLSELFKSTTDALSDKIDDVKARLGVLESEMVGRRQERTERREASGAIYGAIGTGVGLLVALLALLGFLIANAP